MRMIYKSSHDDLLIHFPIVYDDLVHCKTDYLLSHFGSSRATNEPLDRHTQELYEKCLQACAAGLLQQRGREYSFGENDVSCYSLNYFV